MNKLGLALGQGNQFHTPWKFML